MRGQRIVASLIAAVIALGAVAAAATATLTQGSSAGKGQTLIRSVSIESATTSRVLDSTYYDG
jgi:hypothetical protein